MGTEEHKPRSEINFNFADWLRNEINAGTKYQQTKKAHTPNKKYKYFPEDKKSETC